MRDSPEEEGGAMEMMQETTVARLRDRGGVMKKDRSDRERLSRNRKRRGGDSRLNNGVGEESSEESVNDDEEDDYEDDRGGVRMFAQPPSANQTASVSLGNHQSLNRKSFPPSVTAAKVIRPAVGSPGWKPADQVIGFSVPRKARSASGKRPQEFSISNSGVGPDQINRQTSTSPVRLTPSPSPVSPPSSSNAPIRKKMKPNGSKPRPPKSGSKPSSSNPEELEIEIAEVLYGMMTQSHSSSKKESDSVNLDIRETNNNKSRVSSPISNSTSQLPQNSGSSAAAPLSAVAPKRKRPRQVTDNLGSSFSVRHSPVSSMTKVEADLPAKKEISSPNAGSAAENGSVPLDFASSQVGPAPSEPPPRDSGRPDVGPAKEEAVTSPKKESPVVRPDNDREASTMTKADSTISAFSAIESQREEKFEIDLMAPPPQMRSSPEREGEINFVSVLEQKPLTKKKEGENCVKSGKEEKNVEPEQKRAKVIAEEGELEKKPVVNPERKINNLQLDLEKQERDISVLSGNKLNPDVQKPLQPQPPKVIKDEPPHTERVAQSGSLPLPMSVASWPGGLPPMGYMAPLQGVVSMDGNTVSPAPIQPLFSHPRPKRCATHCYIARNIHYLQQFMKMNPFWPPPAGSAASLFGAKPCNLNLMPSAELQGNNAASKILNSVQEKGQGLSIFPGQAGKDKGSQANNIADAQRKQQQIMLQQALPPGAPNNILHGPAFIFPLQQAAAAATASVRPGSVKPPTASGNVASTTASTSASASGSTTAPAAATAVTFNYPNMPANETQFLAILQNNPYHFPIPSVGAPPTYRGTPAQAVPFYNGSFYSSQMMHPAQLQQQQQQQPSTQQQNTSSGSSSSQKHLHSQQQQQRPQGSSGNNLHNFPAPKKTNQHMPNAEVGGEDSPSTADSRVSRASKGVYGQNFAAVPMPIHSQNFALMSPALSVLGGAAGGGGSQGEKKQQQGLKAGVESITPTFAMSFGSMSGVDMSSVAQNHAVLQSLPESTRHTFQMMHAAAAAQNPHQKKNFRVSEEVKTAAATGDSSNNVDEEKKNSTVKPPSTVGQQSIVFSRTDLPDSISTPSLRSTRSSTTPNAMANANAPPNAPLQAQLQYQQHQQQMMHQLKQHQQQQQQQYAAAAAAASRNKPPSTSNGSVYSDHLASSTKFPNGISNFPQNLVQSSSSSSPGQSHQWKNSMKTASQVPTTASSLKSPPQQQTRTQHNQTQISFGAAQKPATPPPPQGQQAAASHQAPSPPMAVGSPTTSSISKGASGSPRTTITAASAASKSAQPSTLASSQPPKNTTSVGSRNVSSVLSSSSHVTSFSNTSAKPQIPQQQQQQQQQMFISHFMQAQVANQQQPFYLQQRRRLEQSQPVSSATSSSTGMLSLSSPVTGSNASTSDAKAAAASATSAAASNLKGGALPSHHLSAVPPGFTYVHAVPSPGQVKPAEQKQPAGNRDSLTRK